MSPDDANDPASGLTFAIRADMIGRAWATYQKTLEDPDGLARVGGETWAQYMLVRRVSYFTNMGWID